MDSQWVSDLSTNISEKVKTISQIWSAIGIEGTRLEARKQTLSSHLFSMLDEMYEEEIAAQQTLSNSVKDLRLKIEELESELGFPHEQFNEALSLVLAEKALFDKFRILDEKAASIVQTFNSLRKEEEQLATRLGEPTEVVIFLHAPNQNQLRALKTNIDFLTMEKVYCAFAVSTYSLQQRSRILQLSEMRHEILNVYNAIDIGELANDQLLSRLNSDNALDNLPLSKMFLSEVKSLRNRCEDLLAEVRSECDRLSADILKLATRLNLDQTEYVDLDQPISSAFLNQLRQDLQRLTEMRRLNLSLFIYNCRAELQELWDACRLSDRERNSDLLQDDGMYTESVLERLEMEISHWREFHAAHQDLFSALDAWQTTFSRFRETEVRWLLRSVYCLFPLSARKVGDAVQPGSSTDRTIINRHPGNKAHHNESKTSHSSTKSKKPRLDFNKTPIHSTPARPLVTPNTGPVSSTRKHGAMTSTPRHSREFLL
ncbi:protein regulator of cytokinesis 1 [Paragonimus westermani]|uniref:Protein regulator of cytokinesis 1 n=1 Tax=Paragonimus westermani TaxID=34504 RepID=A0A5J4NAQ9_9TREM|nr:protein regulator of cytokinesis 1 [Paragonimus westermani]